jgi:hypothetical protein
MAEKGKITIILVSGACCLAHLAKVDKVVEANLQQAINELGTTIEVQKVSLSAILAGGGGITVKQRELLLAYFQRYSGSFTPAILIEDKVRFAARPPSVDELKQVFKEVASAQPA